MLRTVIFGIIAAGAEILGGILIIYRKEWPRKIQEYLIALSAGFILALAFFDLIPESIEHLGVAAPIYIIIGFSALHFFEHTLVGHLHFGEETHAEAMISPIASISALSGLVVHAFFDGVSISAGLQFDLSIGVLIFIAVLLHKLPEGLTIASIMMAAKRTRNEALWSCLAIGASTMLGVIAIYFFSGIASGLPGIAFGFSAGAATYVGASDLIPEINRSKNRIIPLIVFGGMLFFYASQTILARLMG